MEFYIAPGTKGFNEFEVKESDTATNYESGLLGVFATPAMIALIEKTAQNSIQDLLPAGYITLGTEICVTHVKAVLPGKIVFCSSELIETAGKKLIFRVTAFDKNGTIGEGIHKRHIVNAQDFMQKLKNSGE